MLSRERMIAAMCEQLVARAAEPFRLDALWPLAERMEQYGIAGFGWGVAWLAGAGTLAVHRDLGAFRDAPERDRLGAIETTAALIHLRRPSRLSTIQLPDAQPFLDPAGRFAFGHNGDFESFRAVRDGYRKTGRIHGRADSEVGERRLEDAWTRKASVGRLLGRLHAELGGQANLALLAADGTPYHYAGNRENPLFAFRLGGIGFVSTAIYSVDRSLFRYAARGATGRAIARPGTTVSLDPRGTAVPG